MRISFLQLISISIMLCIINACMSQGDEQGPNEPFVGVIPEGGRVIDVHMHCVVNESLTKCDTNGWDSQTNISNVSGVILALGHFAVDPDKEQPGLLAQNKLVAQAAKENPRLSFFASLDCWHDTNFDPKWVNACIEDATHWVSQGSLGFKDHAGKQFTSTNKSHENWLGAWNRKNGFCTATDNLNCMQENTVRYPLLTALWRSVVEHITQILEKPILTHAVTFISSPARCYDPLSKTTLSCHEATKAHFLDFAAWAKQNLNASARKRIILGHSGFLYQDLNALRAVLDAGLSIELSALFHHIRRLALDTNKKNQLADILNTYHRQILFGTDAFLDSMCINQKYAGWAQLLAGIGTKNMSICGGTYDVPGLALPSETLVPILSKNFQEITSE